MKKIILILVFFIFILPAFSQELIKDIIPRTIFCKETGQYVYISILIKSGQVYESGYNAGMSNFISNLLLNQTKLRSSEELAEIFYSTGCNLSVEVNLDYIEIKVITLKKTFADAIEIIGECLIEPKVSNETIIKSKEETIEKMNDEYDTSFQRLYETLRQNIYTGNPYKRSLYGTVQSIKNIDKSSISKYYSENFSLSNIIISIVGDLNKDDIKNYIYNAFLGGYKYTKRPIYDYMEKLSNNKHIELVNYDYCDTLSYYLQGYFAPGVQDKDYFSFLVLSGILGEGKASLIFREIRQKFGIGYHIGFKFHKLRRQSHAYLYLSCFDFDKEKVLKAKNEFLFIINQIKEFGVSPEDLNRAKIYIITQYNIENLNLINKAHNIAWNDAICGDYKRFFSFENDINKITNDDVKNVVNKYFTEYCEIISQPIDKNE